MKSKIDISFAKSYATEANLIKGLKKLNLINENEETFGEGFDRYMIVQNLEGRYTAIFILDKSVGGYMARYSYYGFISV